VTGGAGFIGSNLCRALLERGIRVRVLDDFSTGRRRNLEGVEEDVEIVEGDLRDLRAVSSAVAGTSVVFHEAAIPSVARSIADPVASNEVNVTGTLNVLLAARDAGVERVVFASSAAVYGNSEVLPLHEGLPTRPVSPYGVTKLAGERYLEAFTRTWGTPTVALRYLNVFGPRQNPRSQYASAIPTFISRTLRGEPVTIYGDGEQARDFVYVGDIVRANVLAAEAPEAALGRTFNIGCGRRHTVNELIATIGSLVPGEHPPAVHAEPRPGEIRDSWSDITMARDVLGFEPADTFESGLERTVEWFSESGDSG
jgi:UDP-glucose 4-epimerase